MSNWFQVVDCGVIVFEGPLKACGDYVIANSGTGSNGHALTIHLATF